VKNGWGWLAGWLDEVSMLLVRVRVSKKNEFMKKEEAPISNLFHSLAKLAPATLVSFIHVYNIERREFVQI
jgi:hypothetical protein